MDPFFVAFGVVFVAELGDKSQLLAMSFATRYGARTVLAGLAIAAAALMAVSVACGAWVAAVVPDRLVETAAGLAFLGFAWWTLRVEGDHRAVVTAGTDGADPPSAGATRGVAAVAGAIALAELGDKTMLAAFTLAATNGLVGTWAGATLGMIAADGIAVLVGNQLAARLPDRVVRTGAAVLFAACGLVLLVSAATG